MKLQVLQDLNNRWLLTPISFKLDPEIGKKHDKKQDSLKVDIKTRPGEIKIEMLSFYIPIYKAFLVKALSKFLVLLKKWSGARILLQGLNVMPWQRTFWY